MNTNFIVSSSEQLALRTNTRLSEMQIRIRENPNWTGYQIKSNNCKVSDCYKEDKANYCYASYGNTSNNDRNISWTWLILYLLYFIINTNDNKYNFIWV